MPLFDIILLPHGAGGDREEVNFSFPSFDINPCSSLLFLLADNILGKKGQSRETGPWGEALTGVPSLRSLKLGVALREESAKDMVGVAMS